jgi:hypothetical protein
MFLQRGTFFVLTQTPQPHSKYGVTLNSVILRSKENPRDFREPELSIAMEI